MKKNIHTKKVAIQTVGNDLLFGAHPILECIRAGKRKVISIYTTKPFPKGWRRIEQSLPKHVQNIQYVSRDVLTRIAGTSDHMGVVAYVSPYKYCSKPFTPETHKRLLLLDGVSDVRNLGAILRSAYCTNVDGVVLCRKGGALMTATVFKASAGLAEHLDVYLYPSIASAVQELKKNGYSLYMAVADEGTNALHVAYESPQCIVIGSEETGIAKDVRKEGILVTLPQRDTSSYNASVAAAIFLFLTAFNK